MSVFVKPLKPGTMVLRGEFPPFVVVRVVWVADGRPEDDPMYDLVMLPDLYRHQVRHSSLRVFCERGHGQLLESNDATPL